MASRRVHVVDGARTPFLKAKKGLGPFSGSDLAVACGRPLVTRQPFDATAFDEVIVGATRPSAFDQHATTHYIYFIGYKGILHYWGSGLHS